jgi:hypothetical protein
VATSGPAVMGEATLAHPSAMTPGKNEKFSVDPLVFPSHAPPKITQEHSGPCSSSFATACCGPGGRGGVCLLAVEMLH